jgi:hypothetical protein
MQSAAPMSSSLKWIKVVLTFGRRWMLHVLIGFPLLSGLIGWYTPSSQWSDIHDKAVQAQTFWREGTITRPDRRGRSLRLTMKDADYREIACAMRPTTRSSCLFGKDFPMRARVELFDYRGLWLIMQVDQQPSGKMIVSRAQSLERYRLTADHYAGLTRERGFWRGFWVGVASLPVVLLVVGLWRREDRIRKEKAASAES